VEAQRDVKDMASEACKNIKFLLPLFFIKKRFV
jgi:hypothetical protein